MIQFQQILDGRPAYDTHRLPGYGCKLAGGTYGMDIVIPDKMDFDESKMSLWIPFADGNRRDGVGDVTEVSGLVTERHRQNPVCLFDHGKKCELPIGVSEDPETKAYTVEIDPVSRTAKGNVFFWQGKGLIPGASQSQAKEHAIYCEQLYHMIVNRLIRGGSFGYQVIDASPIPSDREMGSPQGLHLRKTLLLEFGPTVIPANMDTVRKMLAMPDCCGKSLSPMLVKSLEPYAPEKKAMVVGGFDSKTLPSSDISPEKAREILKDGTVHGKPLTEKQRGMFGAAAGKKSVEDLSVHEERLNAARRAWQAESQQPRRTATDKARMQKVSRELGEAERAYEEASRPKNKSVKPPLDNLPDTKIPPARWKPGVGAVKELRQKYRTAKGLRRRTRKSMEGASTMWVNAKDLEAAKKWAERKGLAFHHVSSKGNLAKVKLIGLDKAMDEAAVQFGKKGVKAMGVMSGQHPRVHGTQIGDLVEILPDPYTGGGKYQGQIGKIVGRLSNGERWRVEFQDGSNSSFDSIMLKHKSLNIKGKTMNDVEDPTPEDPIDSTDAQYMEHEGGEDKANEKYSAQVLRTLHKNAMILLQEYDEMRGPLEHEHIDKHLESKLQTLVDEIEEIESLFSKHHPDADPLESAEEKSLDEEEGNTEGVEEVEETSDASESGDETMEEPTPEEAMEGMETADEEEAEEKAKSFRIQNTKALKEKYGKTYPDDDFQRDPRTGKPIEETEKKRGISSRGIRQGQSGVTVVKKPLPSKTSEKSICSACKDKGKESCTCGSKSVKAPAKDGYQKAIPGDEEYQEKPGDEVDTMAEDTDLGDEEYQESPGEEIDSFAKALDDKERSKVGEAATWADELSRSPDYGEEHRMKSYYHHKALGEIGGTIGNLIAPGIGGAVGAAVGGTADMAMDQSGKAMDDMDEESLLHPHRKMCKSASQFFKELAYTRDFGDMHREKAMMCAKALNDIATIQEEQEIQEDISDGEVPEPGEMGEKGEPDPNYKPTSRFVQGLVDVQKQANAQREAAKQDVAKYTAAKKAEANKPKPGEMGEKSEWSDYESGRGRDIDKWRAKKAREAVAAKQPAVPKQSTISTTPKQESSEKDLNRLKSLFEQHDKEMADLEKKLAAIKL